MNSDDEPVATPIAPDERAKLILEEAKAGLSQQRSDLENIRGRASGLLTAGGLAATFFGAIRSQQDHSGRPTWPLVLAAIFFVILLFMVAFVQWPRKVIFHNDARIMLKHWRDLPYEDFMRHLATYTSDNRDTNQAKIEFLTNVFIGGLVAFVLEILSLGLDLTLGLAHG